MEENKSQYGVQSAPVATPEVDRSGTWIVVTPNWVTIVRGVQLFFAFVILILSGIIIHGLALDAVCFALVCCLFTFIIVLYAILTEKIVGWRKAYNHWAVVALEALMVIFWLSSMAAVAHLRSTFKYNVQAQCWSDGSAVNSGHCITSRGIDKRYAVATKAGLAEMSAIAGLSALMMLLFIATLIFVGHTLRMHYNSLDSPVDASNVEMNAQQQQPMLHQQQQQQAPSGPAYSDQYQYNPYGAGVQPIQPQYTQDVQHIQPQYTGQQEPHHQPVQPQAYQNYSAATHYDHQQQPPTPDYQHQDVYQQHQHN